MGTVPPGCVFCTGAGGSDDRANLILYRGHHAFIILNLYPYNPGHLMVVPFLHADRLDLLDGSTRSELFDLASVATIAIGSVMTPGGFNLGMNLGRAAGAGIADHVHLHVVPRWDGDTNFMPVLAETKVLSETLAQTYNKLKPAIAGLVP